MCLFQAALDTCLDSPLFASLSVHGLHFTVYAPSICPEFCSEFSPNYLRGVFVLRFVGNGDEKKFTKKPRHFSRQNSQASKKKYSQNVFWRAGKVTSPPQTPPFGPFRQARRRNPNPNFLVRIIFGWGGGPPREGVGAKKFGTSFETQANQTFRRDISGFVGLSRGCPKSLRKKKLVFNSCPLFLCTRFRNQKIRKSENQKLEPQK